MSFTEGRVAVVTEEIGGSELAGDAAEDATEITVVDPTDFDFDGGQLTVYGDTQVYTYTVGDLDDPTTLTIDPPLISGYEAGMKVELYPQTPERFAHVMTPGAEDELVCRVPHSLYDRLDVGIRGDEAGPEVPPTYAELVEQADADLYWPLDSVDGATDQSGNAHNGTGAGGVTIGGNGLEPAGFASGSTDFDGSNDWVVAPGTYTGMEPQATFEGWAYRDQDAGWMGLVGIDAVTDTELLIHYGSTDVSFRVNGTAVTWSSAWPGNTQWVHFALTFDEAANVAELFINGVSKGTKTQAGNWPAGGGYGIQVGYHGYSGAYDGKLAHFAVYPSVLTPSDILAHYETGADLLPPAEETLAPIPPENVIATLDDDEWVVSDVLDKSPVISGAYVDTAQDSVPLGISTTPVTGSYTATDAAITVTPDAAGKLLVFWGAGVLLEADAATGRVTCSVTLSLLVDGVQTGQERTLRFTNLRFVGTGDGAEIPVTGTATVEVEEGVEYDLAVAVKGTETLGFAEIAAGKTGGLSYVALGG